MAIKRYKPITPGTRSKTVSDFAEITADNQEPYRAEVTFGFTGDTLK